MTIKGEYSKLGDIAHALSIGSTVAFAYAVAKYAKPESKIFDPVWMQDGFCVANRDVPYWNSHDMCLYVDTLMAAVAAVLYFSLKDSPGMHSANILIKTNILGIFGHGLGHGGISHAMRDGKELGTVADLADKDLLEMIVTLAPFMVFWLLLLGASMPNLPKSSVALASIPAMALSVLIPPQFGFTYVQTVLLLAFSLNQLAKPMAEKDFAFAMYPIMVSVPLGIVGWIESTCCSSFVIDVGGHVIYDAYIPISMMSFYILCWLRGGGEKLKKA